MVGIECYKCIKRSPYFYIAGNIVFKKWSFIFNLLSEMISPWFLKNLCSSVNKGTL
jgi:hypothetical protein